MDPFNIIMTLIILGLLVIFATPFVKIFNFAVRSMVKSCKKTYKTIQS